MPDGAQAQNGLPSQVVSRRARRSVLIIVVVAFDEFAFPGFTALMDGEYGDGETGDRIEPGSAGECKQTEPGEGGDAQQHADPGFGGVGHDQRAPAELQRDPALWP
ncbi:hypothetical protein [Cryptosporangium minutisporangium]|uniref:hypothetical protein n=1 Tax=Cryptosporangium minutisporangium TaxID=113569 RepID=UPI0031E4F414